MMDNSEALMLQIAGCSIIGLGGLVFTPILIYYWHQFYRLSRTVTMKHKNKKLINYMMICTIFGLVFEIPFIILCKMLFIDIMNDIYLIHSWIISAIDSCYLALIFLFYSIYLWLLFYYKQYHIAIAEIAWKKAINARYRSWYILNKNKFGDYHYIIKISIIPFIIYCIFQCFIEYVLFHKNLSFHSVVLLSIIFIIPSFMISYKLRKSSDIFDIKKEIHYQCISVIIFVIIYLTELITDFITFSNNHNNTKYSLFYQIQTLTISFLTTVIIFAMALILIKFSLNQAKSLLNPWTKNSQSALSVLTHPKMLSLEKTSTVSRDSKLPDNLPQQPSTSNHGINSMLETISDNAGFKAYMQHLV